MDISYRLGLSIVSGTLALSLLLCAAVVNPRPERPPAGEDQADAGRTLGDFELVERSGRTIRESDLADRVWIAAFVFSRCPTSCPVISKKMRDLQGALAGTDVTLVSITVDPDYDTPTVLKEFASRYGADPDRWLYLTGPKDDVYSLILDRFGVSVQENSSPDRQEGAEAVAHSNRLVLVGPGNLILGSYQSNDPGAMRRLEAEARRADRMKAARRVGWVFRLPSINAALNAMCACLLVISWGLIRARKARLHAVGMLSAIAVSALFLTSYLVYHYFVGSVPFRGEGPIRLVYLSILLSHTILAVVAVPLIGLTVYRALRGRFHDHARIARVTFPIWLYVSITGVVVYLMLYQMPLPSPVS